VRLLHEGAAAAAAKLCGVTLRWTMLPLPLPLPVEQARLTAGPVETPVPVSMTDCGLPWALEVTVIEPVLVPLVVGRKLTLIVHLAPTAKPVPQLSDSRKSPLGTMLVMVTAAPPVLASIMLCAWLTVATV